ncbi:protocatechuate 3,4-dioxygenase subunit alpha [Deinococcus aluminii]|uniref:Protocatechuate 3,4-dioxygenase alpha chain n=1 Tax=Deinococcus aluminii TaxID=1656885 RepID=A0ABP9XB76_9DEIO
MRTEGRLPLSPEDSNIPRDAFGPSPSQTVGPYFHQGLVHGQDLPLERENLLVVPGDPLEGERVTVTGRVLDGDGLPVPDALVEVWQADPAGRFPPDTAFHGFGRSDTRREGGFWLFRTVKPGRVGGQAPHLNVWLGMRGLLTHLPTRIYFSDEDNGADPVLALVPPARRQTLIARREETPDGPLYRLDFHMQGERETVFFDVG